MEKISRFDLFKHLTLNEMAHYFCEQVDFCDECPVEKRCTVDQGRYGKLGFVAYLEDLVEEG